VKHPFMPHTQTDMQTRPKSTNTPTVPPTITAPESRLVMLRSTPSGPTGPRTNVITWPRPDYGVNLHTARLHVSSGYVPCGLYQVYWAVKRHDTTIPGYLEATTKWINLPDRLCAVESPLH
jgi:hypothetical protein